MNLLSTGRQFLIVVLLAGCGDAEQPSWEKVIDGVAEQPSREEIIDKVNSSGTITDKQAESLSTVEELSLNGLTSITDKQAKSLAKVDSLEISEACQKLIDKYKKQ